MPNWRPVDRDASLERYEAAQARRTYGDGDYWKPKVGPAGGTPARNIIRILPPHVNMVDASNRPEAFQETKVHFSLGPKMDVAVNCLKPFGKDCPACEWVDSLWKDAKAETDVASAAALKDQARRQGAKLRYGCNMVDLEHPEKGVQQWFVGTDVEKKLRATFKDDDGEWRDITDPYKGRDIIIAVAKKPGTDFNEYTEIRAKETPSAIRDEGWLDKITDLSERAKEPTVEEVLGALAGERKKTQVPAAAPAKERAPVQPQAIPPKEAAPKAVRVPKAAKAAVEEAREPLREDDGREPLRSDPYEAARAVLIERKVTIMEITPDETEKIVAAKKAPRCFLQRADPGNQMCVECRLLLPCLTAVMAAVPA